MAKVAADRLAKAKAHLLAEISLEVKDQRVLQAMARVPRERFLSPELRPFAYENRPLPIGYGQTISQPLIVAMMTEKLNLSGGDKVLEIGTGSGYQAAILGELAAEVISVERIAPLAEQAAQVLAELGYRNVRVFVAEEVLGWPQAAPYNAILVTAGAPEVPEELLGQLALGGRLVIPVGGRDLQELLQVTKTAEGTISKQLGPCRFVPLLGSGAWSPSEAWG